MSFYTLPDEILLIIFNHCNTNDLIRLSGVCKRFCRITSECLNKKSNHLLVTGQMSEKFRERCKPLLSSYKTKFSTHYNWKHGDYARKILFPRSLLVPRSARKYSRNNVVFYQKCWRHLHMTKDTIWLNDRFNLCALNRTRNGSVSDHNWVVKECKGSILDIVPCNDVIVTNHYGSIRQWTIESLDGKKYFNEKLLRSFCRDDDSVMDITSRNIIRGLRCGEIKIWKYMPQENAIAEENIICNEISIRILKSIAFDPTGTKCVACYGQRNSIYKIYDINKCYAEKEKKIDDILFKQLLWKDPNTILFQGMSKITKVDVRTQKVVHEWDFPCDLQPIFSGFSCMSSDNLYAIITGTMNYGFIHDNPKVILWDQRQSAFIQTYEVPRDNINFYQSRCVNSLEFDSSHMYVATDKIHEFNFAKI